LATVNTITLALKLFFRPLGKKHIERYAGGLIRKVHEYLDSYVVVPMA
jgi:hypothetical protein